MAGFESYLSERFSLSRWAPLALLLGFAATPSGATFRWETVVALSSLAFLALFSFRSLDDLRSLAEDKTAHPARTLSRSTSIAPFWFASIAGSVIAAAALVLLGGWKAALVYLGLYGVLFVLGRATAKGAVMLRLGKYSVLTLVLGSLSRSTSLDIALCAAFLYPAFLINEAKGVLWPFYLSSALIILTKVVLPSPG